MIGEERFLPYLNERGGDEAEALRLYSWNIEASAALLGSYAALEVGLRNAMHDRLTTMYGTENWWDASNFLSPKSLNAISDAERFLDRTKGAGKWGAGHLVAEMTPSFWEDILANRNHTAVWLAGLQDAFPHFAGYRKDLKEQLERLRLLRNRAAHHEPVFARDLTVDHRYMCEVAGYIDTDMKTWIATHSRLPSVISVRPTTITGERMTRF